MRPCIVYDIYVGLRSRDGEVFLLDETQVNHILQLCNVDSATIFHTGGFWKGNAEPSFMVRVVDTKPGTLCAEVRAVACRLRELYKQDSALVTAQSEGITSAYSV